MSKREAARRANISEGRWRQIVTGVQRMGKGNVIPTTTKPETLTAMARAVHADVRAVLVAGGFEPLPERSSDGVGAGVDDDDEDFLYQRPGGLSDDQWPAEKRRMRAVLNAMFDQAAEER